MATLFNHKSGTLKTFRLCSWSQQSGRGYSITVHPGNIALRTRVHAVKAEFLVTKKNKAKRKMARDIVEAVEQSGGRFLIEDASGSGVRGESLMLGADDAAPPSPGSTSARSAEMTDEGFAGG